MSFIHNKLKTVNLLFIWNAVGFQLNLENEIPVGSKRKRV